MWVMTTLRVLKDLYEYVLAILLSVILVKLDLQHLSAVDNIYVQFDGDAVSGPTGPAGRLGRALPGDLCA